MLRFLVLLVYIGIALAQFRSPQEAAIIRESRYLNIAGQFGQFGSSYSQQDGVEFNEEADSEGNRKGSYSYIDPTGQRKTVTYTAGKDGFQAIGDHLPVAPPVPVNPFAVPGILQSNLQGNYQIHQSEVSTPSVQPISSLEVQLQSLPVPEKPQLNLLQVQPIPLVSSTEIPPPMKHYPPGKLDVKQTAEGFSYTFNSLT